MAKGWIDFPPPGVSEDYLAANGHLMTTHEWGYSEAREEWVRIQFSATHSVNCSCETNGSDIPDW